MKIHKRHVLIEHPMMTFGIEHIAENGLYNPSDRLLFEWMTFTFSADVNAQINYVAYKIMIPTYSDLVATS